MEKNYFQNEMDVKRAVFAEESIASGPADAVGLSWMLRYINGTKVIRHGGASVGQYSELLFVPERRFGMILLANGENFIPEAVDLLAKEYLNFALTRVFPPAIPMKSESLQRYIGRYKGLANDIDVMPNDGGLLMKYNYKKVFPDQESIPAPPPPLQAVFYERDRCYIIQDKTMCDFIKNDEGEVTFLRHGNRIHVKEK